MESSAPTWLVNAQTRIQDLSEPLPAPLDTPPKLRPRSGPRARKLSALTWIPIAGLLVLYVVLQLDVVSTPFESDRQVSRISSAELDAMLAIKREMAVLSPAAPQLEH